MNENDASRASLERGLQALGLALNHDQCDLLWAYLTLLHKWNRAYNLSAVREPSAMIPRHLLDSLAVLPHVQGSHFLDVGSGAGLPGIPLAIALPQATFTLIDSNGKKTRFLHQAGTELGLDNVTVVQERVEHYRPPSPFDAIISRAFAGVNAMLASCRHVLADGGRCYAMVGRYPADDLAQLRSGFRLQQCHRLQVPVLDGERHLLEIVPTDP